MRVETYQLPEMLPKYGKIAIKYEEIVTSGDCTSDIK